MNSIKRNQTGQQKRFPSHYLSGFCFLVLFILGVVLTVLDLLKN